MGVEVKSCIDFLHFTNVSSLYIFSLRISVFLQHLLQLLGFPLAVNHTLETREDVSYGTRHIFIRGYQEWCRYPNPCAGDRTPGWGLSSAWSFCRGEIHGHHR